MHLITLLAFPGGANVKNPPASAGDIGNVGSVTGSGTFAGGQHHSLLQYSCLENPVDLGVWQATSPPGRKELDMTKATQHAHTHVNFL